MRRIIHGGWRPKYPQHPTQRRFLMDYKSRYELEQAKRSRTIGGLVVLGIMLGVVGTYVRLKIMTVSPPTPSPPNSKQKIDVSKEITK